MDPTRHKMVADDALQELHRFALDADVERRQLHDAVVAIRNTLTDPAQCDHLKVDLALRLTMRTLQAWDLRRAV